jgi:hypothetical protein
MVASYTSVAVTPQPAWRLYKFRDDEVLPAYLAAGNLASPSTPFGEILSGTLMCYDPADPTAGCRPMPVQQLESAIVAANVGEVDDAANFYVGDEIDIVAGEDLYDEVTFTAGASGAEIKAVAKNPGDTRMRITLIDPGAASQPLTVVVADDGTNLDVSVYLATDGGSVITSTVQDVIDALNNGATFALLFATLDSGAGGELAIAVSAQALTGGFLEGEVIVDGRNVTDVDKTSSPNTVTFDGATVDVPATAVLKLADLIPEFVAGVLVPQPDTIQRISGQDVEQGYLVELAIAGAVIASLLTGYEALLAESYLQGGHVSSGVLGPGTAPTSFIFTYA